MVCSQAQMLAVVSADTVICAVEPEQSTYDTSISFVKEGLVKSIDEQSVVTSQGTVIPVQGPTVVNVAGLEPELVTELSQAHIVKPERGTL